MPHDGHHFDPERLAQMEASRQQVFPPEETLDHFLTRPDLIMADIGCGPGFYAIPAAKRLPQGRVFAIDRQQDMLEWTAKRATEAKLTNLSPIQAMAHDIPIADASVDVVLMANVLHDLPDYPAILNEVLRILKPGGTYFLVEWDKVPTDFGPPLEVRFSPSELITFVERYGFDRVQKIEAPSPWFQVMAHKPIP